MAVSLAGSSGPTTTGPGRSSLIIVRWLRLGLEPDGRDKFRYTRFRDDADSALIRRGRRVRGAGRVRAAVGLGLHRRQARTALRPADDLPYRADGRGGAGAWDCHPAHPAGVAVRGADVAQC